tara:strand:+ start:559 stop:804 length:246 start_codon:yes stop_codon:yes gene_type:complete
MNAIRTGIVSRYQVNDRSYLSIFESHHKNLYVVVEEDDRRNFEYGTLTSSEIYDKYRIQMKSWHSIDIAEEEDYGRMSSNQ